MPDTPSFYNSLSKKVEPLKPLEENRVKIYHCGPTVYKRQHIGNMRRFLFADFLDRSLEFLGYDVDVTMNITDVGHLTQDDVDAGEDKLEKEAREKKMKPEEIAAEQTELFKQDLLDLNIEIPEKLLKATDNIDSMVDLIKKLLDKDLAYETKTGIYFDVTKFKDYGKLSGNTLDKLEAGARVTVDEDKLHPADFALWKLNDPEHLQQWDSPWGKGYPGWHIECSAMAGEQVDIHTGGQDNKFPHHENEIAQSEGASGKQFVQLWMHNAWLQLQGEKLAKREGEQITIDTIKEKGVSPLAFRLLVFGSHYRKPLEFSWESLQAAQEQLDGLKNFLRRTNKDDDQWVALRKRFQTEDAPLEGDRRTGIASQIQDPWVKRFTGALADDLNTPQALAVVMDFVREVNAKIDAGEDVAELCQLLDKFDEVLGIFNPLWDEILAEQGNIPAEITKVAQEREQARAAKDFAKADELREKIEAAGFELEDTPNGARVVKK